MSDAPNRPNIQVPAATEIDIQYDTNGMSSPLSSVPEDAFTQHNDATEPNNPSEGGTDELNDFSDPNTGMGGSEAAEVNARKIGMKEVESELGLSSKQGTKLLETVKSELQARGLLGQYLRDRVRYTTALPSIIVNVKSKLAFLGAAKISEARRDALLLARVKKCRENEVHEQRLLRRGKVAKRRDGTTYVLEIEEDSENEEKGKRDEVEEHEAGPSVVAQDLTEFNVGVGTVPELGPKDVEGVPTPSSPMHIEEPEPVQTSAPVDEAEPVHAPIQLDGLCSQATVDLLPNSVFPKALVVRVVNSIAGAVVHVPHLLVASSDERSGNNLSFSTFLTLVSEQLGFNVRGCMSAVVPKFHAVAPIDILATVHCEAQWRGVLQVWQSTRRNIGEFVVEA